MRAASSIGADRRPGSPRRFRGHTEESALLLAKIVKHDDFRTRYGGSCIGLVGAVALDPPPLHPRTIALPFPSGPEARERALALMEDFLSTPGGYANEAEARAVLLSALRIRRSFALSFITFVDHAERLDAFLERAADLLAAREA